MTHGEKTAILIGAVAMTLGLLTGLTPAASLGALVLLVAALTVVLRTTWVAVEGWRSSTSGR